MKTIVVVTVRGGFVESVYSNDPLTTEVIVADLDQAQIGEPLRQPVTVEPLTHADDKVRDLIPK